MNATMQAVIDTETAALVRVVPAADPAADLGWGSDLDCADDIDEYATELAGDNVRILQQAIYHRLTTARGQLPGDTEDEANYGIDLLDLVAVGMDPSAISELQSRVAAELSKDDRFDNVKVDAVAVDEETLEVAISAETVTGVPFDLVIQVTDGATLLKATG